MRKLFHYLLIAALVTGIACNKTDDQSDANEQRFVTVDGVDLIQPNGEKLYIVGTNLGNWLNPEGYMFNFRKTNSGWMIDQALRELVGPDATDEFWTQFKDNYITRADIEYIAATGANTIRLPFNYKSFTDEDYMGLAANQDGFERVDSLVEWCRDNNLYLILDMHDCPGGQTGDNIDNSYGYPWLFYSEKAQQQFCDIWKMIAEKYVNEPVILGYELMNEPIPHFFEDKEITNAKLEPLYKRAVAAIREVDNNHIILLGGAQWNSNFEPFTDWKFDDKIMYTCHRYGGEATQEAFQSFIDFRDKTGLPMYMGEIGHNTMEWQAGVCDVMRNNNIGYTFWPYKKLGESCMMGIAAPEQWDSIVVAFAEAPRTTYAEMREAKGGNYAEHEAAALKALNDFITNCRLENCIPQDDYIRSMGLTPVQK